jgi:sulfur carrier protein
MNLTVNGRPHHLDTGATVAILLVSLGLEVDAGGVAVAVDGAVVPRSRWTEHRLDEGMTVEIVTATQGG